MSGLLPKANRLRQRIARFLGRPALPRLSVIVVFYDMPRQALNTLWTLSARHQLEVSEEDYEIIAVENRSDNNIDQDALAVLGSNIRYFLRDEDLPSPVNAVNFGASQARAPQLCIMVDGARMVTPKLVHYMIMANRLYDNSVVSVPGYHLGNGLQQKTVLNGYNEEEEKHLLESCSWQQNGYALFGVSCLSGTSQSGFFRPLGESNSLGVTQHIFERLGGFDPGFTETGGGQCNLDFYKRALELAETKHVFLPGEGSFHQFHGGVTTGREAGEKRQQTMQKHFDQYKALRGEYFSPAHKDPVYLGEIAPTCLRFVHESSARALTLQGGDSAGTGVKAELTGLDVKGKMA